MTIFGTIMSKIFSHPQAANPTGAPLTPASTSTGPTGATGSVGPVRAAGPTAASPMSTVDVESVLKDLASKYNHPVNWRYSIVDLMAILGIDNSLAQRKALAKELGYTGDTNDSATMNIWLHKEVMRKLAENGGMVSADLLQENK